MSFPSTYSKYYIYLSEHDKGFGTDTPPSGFIRFELKGDQCLIRIEAANIKSPSTDYSYNCYLICSERSAIEPFLIGSLSIVNSKALLTAEIARKSIFPQGLTVENYDTVVVSLQPNNTNVALKSHFPLVGYRDENVRHINDFERIFKKADSVNSPAMDNAISNKSEEKSDSSKKISMDNCEKTCLAENGSEFFKGNPEVHILENMLSIYFSKCKPFQYEQDDIKWWKINNCALLKKILNYHGFSEIFLSSSYLYNSYYVYGYFIVGIHHCSQTTKFFYGIPSLYGMDMKPYTLKCRWESECNEGELYGEFGYWIVECKID